jgi:hypothetical protein
MRHRLRLSLPPPFWSNTYPNGCIGSGVGVILRKKQDERDAMAMLNDLLKGNILTAVAVGVGAVFLAPLAGPVLRPTAKAAIKGGILAYQGLSGLGEVVGDILAEAQHEVAARLSAEAEAATPPSGGRRENRSREAKP